MKMLKRLQFEEIKLPLTDAIFTKHYTSDIANRIGIPILTRRYPLDPKWANSKDAMFEGMSPCNNQDTTFLSATVVLYGLLGVCALGMFVP
jgi:hypothetical protein